MPAAGQEHVVVAPTPNDDPLALWSPVVGEETTALLQKSLDDAATRSTVVRQSASILGRCPGPQKGLVDSRTGLVVGYVQSGKTLSFTTLISLARDNGFPIVVLLAGTKKNLHEQTAARLAHDLAVERPGGMTPWHVLDNPAPTSQAAETIAGHVRELADPDVPHMFKRTTVITVMKNSNRLDKLEELLARLPEHGVDLGSIPVLVVDDEADQAGLNGAVRKDDETATYKSILQLRALLPRHAYVMYTATPQAPLLVNLADLLSPDFVTVLTPGPGYTGGRYFFDEHRSSFLQQLSPSQVDEALAPEGPPASLERALATYLLVRAAQPPTRLTSMLVHPSHGKGLQGTYGSLVNQLRAAWQTLLKRPEADADRDDLVQEVFGPAWKDLASSNPELPALDVLLKTVPFWLTSTQVRVVNSETPEESDIVWNTAPSWILIGGNKLDRGFTVEGLAVTYMPRSIGVGNIDTLQQRARFFGYKGSYGSYCRAWLSPDSSDAFIHYVEHEELLRADLAKADAEGQSLQSWTRQMLLDPQFKPTRRTVIDLPYLHGRFRGDSWESVARVAGLGAEAGLNRSRVEALVAAHAADRHTCPDDPRADKHETFGLPLAELLSELLADWRGHPEDRALVRQVVLLLQSKVDEDPSLEADVYLMDGLRERQRSLRDDRTTVSALQQGRAPKGPYQGDKEFFVDGRVAVQVHNLRNKDGQSAWAAVGLSIRLPHSLAGGAIVQVPDDEDA